MSDNQQIQTGHTEIQEWIIKGSDGGHTYTITARHGDRVDVSTDGRWSMSAELANAVADAFQRAAVFVVHGNAVPVDPKSIPNAS